MIFKKKHRKSREIFLKKKLRNIEKPCNFLTTMYKYVLQRFK